MSQFPFINLAGQYQTYSDEIAAAVERNLSSTVFIGGEEVSSFESELSEFCGASYSIGCSSGTDALLLALLALDVKAGDEVIVPSFTFVATAEVVALLGCVPVFADVGRQDALIDPTHLESLITPKTKAIIPVSLFGQCADMDAMNRIGEAHGIAIIEDAAQSFGAMVDGKHSCNLSQLACTSFFPAKPLGAYGDGGAVFTSDSNLAEKIFQLRNHGQSALYEYTSVGINGRLDALQAAILRVKLSHFADELRSRAEKAMRYRSELPDWVESLAIAPERTSSFAQYTIVCDQRDSLAKHLSKHNIASAVYYPKPLHKQAIFCTAGRSEASLPVTDTLAQKVLSLPMCAFLTDDNQARVIDAIHQFR